MTVKQLIKYLQCRKPDAEVVTGLGLSYQSVMQRIHKVEETTSQNLVVLVHG